MVDILRFSPAAFCFIGLADAFTAFEPNCTVPPAHVNFVTSSPGRGTVDIFWSCASVLLLCTWAVQHLSVPAHTEPENPSWNRALLEKARFNVQKLKWMGLTLIGPEYMLGKALAENLAARYSKKQFADKNWTPTHGYFANMRGFVLRFDIAAVPTSLRPSSPEELGQSLQKPRADGKPPYEPQDVERSRAIEIEHCHKICGTPCRNRPNTASNTGGGLASSLGTSFQNPSTHQSDNLGIQEKNIGVEQAAGGAIAKPDETTETRGGSAGDGSNKPAVETTETEQTIKIPKDSAGDRSNTPAVEATETEQTTKILKDSAGDRPTKPAGEAQNNIPNGDAEPPRHNTQSQTASQQTIVGSAPNSPNNGLESLQPDSGKASIRSNSPISATEKESLGPHKIWKGTWPLNSDQMHYAYQERIIPTPPDVSAEALSDRSKGDALVKGLAIWQITWLVIQIIARAFQNLAITLLEVTVLAFATCAIVIYIALWHKPQDVKIPIYVDAPNVLTREQIIGLAARSPVSSLIVHEFWLHGVSIRAMADNIFPSSPGIPLSLPGVKGMLYLNPVPVGIGLGGALFGAVHCGAWNFEFPTPVERLLWRISCILLVALPLFGTGVYWYTQHMAQIRGTTDTKVNRLLKPLGYTFVPIYVLARLFLFVEVFRSLGFLPTSAFSDVNWPTALPRIS